MTTPSAPRIVPLLVLLVLAVAGCAEAGTPTGDQPATTTTPDGADPAATAGPPATATPAADVGARFLDRLSLTPDELDELPLVAATNPDALTRLDEHLAGVGLEDGALADVDIAAELVAVLDGGECAVGTAEVVLDGDHLRLDGVESDGVCEAIDHEVHVVAVPWAALPDEVRVENTTVTRPG